MAGWVAGCSAGGPAGLRGATARAGRYDLVQWPRMAEGTGTSTGTGMGTDTRMVAIVTQTRQHSQLLMSMAPIVAIWQCVSAITLVSAATRARFPSIRPPTM